MINRRSIAQGLRDHFGRFGSGEVPLAGDEVAVTYGGSSSILQGLTCSRHQ
jgi:hypothetical protein